MAAGGGKPSNSVNWQNAAQEVSGGGNDQLSCETTMLLVITGLLHEDVVRCKQERHVNIAQLVSRLVKSAHQPHGAAYKSLKTANFDIFLNLCFRLEKYLML